MDVSKKRKAGLMELKETYIDTNSVRLHVVQVGPEDGKLVILLHGFPEFWYGWKKQIGPLAAAGLQVWAPDQRGYNLSDKPAGLDAYRLDELARDILGLISASGQEKVSVAGHDWGAMVAWWLGIQYPGRLDKLAILNVPHPSVFQRILRTTPEQMYRSWYAAFFQIPVLPEATLRNRDWELAEKMMRRSSRPGTFTDPDFEKYRSAWWKKGAMTAMLNWYRAFLRLPPNLSGDMRVRVPTRIIWGMKDSALSQKLVQPSLDMCDHGELITFNKASHWVQHEEAGAVNQLLIDHFK